MTDHRLEFTDSENPWAPTAVIAEINERTGSGLHPACSPASAA